MYAVIFRAEINELDDAYITTASRMRELAKSKYGCLEFISCTEGNQEVAVSYWETQEQIKLWKRDAEHQAAQDLGISTWYKSYQVQVVEIIREYKNQHNQRVDLTR